MRGRPAPSVEEGGVFFCEKWHKCAGCTPKKSDDLI